MPENKKPPVVETTKPKQTEATTNWRDLLAQSLALYNAGHLAESKLLISTHLQVKSKVKKRSGEDEFYDAVKQKRVIVRMAGAYEIDGILEWVTQYTLGVREGNNALTLIGKGQVVTLRAYS